MNNLFSFEKTIVLILVLASTNLVAQDTSKVIPAFNDYYIGVKTSLNFCFVKDNSPNSTGTQLATLGVGVTFQKRIFKNLFFVTEPGYQKKGGIYNYYTGGVGNGDTRLMIEYFDLPLLLKLHTGKKTKSITPFFTMGMGSGIAIGDIQLKKADMYSQSISRSSINEKLDNRFDAYFIAGAGFFKKLNDKLVLWSELRYNVSATDVFSYYSRHQDVLFMMGLGVGFQGKGAKIISK